MKLKKTTWILMLTALLSLGWVTLYEIPRQQQTVNNAQEPKIFNIQENQIKKIIIDQPDLTLEFVLLKDQENSWQMVKPEKILANDAVIAFLVELMVNGTSERVITLDNASLAEYGLDKPRTTIIFTTTEDQTHKIALGKSTISDRFIYAQVFSDSQINNQIMLVEQNWHYAVNREYQEWKQENN